MVRKVTIWLKMYFGFIYKGPREISKAVLAQPVERMAFNHVVVGSIPTDGAISLLLWIPFSKFFFSAFGFSFSVLYTPFILSGSLCYHSEANFKVSISTLFKQLFLLGGVPFNGTFFNFEIIFLVNFPQTPKVLNFEFTHCHCLLCWAILHSPAEKWNQQRRKNPVHS